MSENNETAATPTNWDATLAFWLLRGWLGLRAVMTGLEKYSSMAKVTKPWIDPKTGVADPGGLTQEVTEKAYHLATYSPIPQSMQDKFAAEPLLPAAILKIFYVLLGPALIALGLMLWAGIGTRTSLFLQGLLYIMLTAGLVMIKEDAGVAWLAIHIALIAMALVLAKHNQLCILKKW